MMTMNCKLVGVFVNRKGMCCFGRMGDGIVGGKD